jgi:flagellar biosynthetic protein FlhB
MAGEKTEKATPKKKKDARKEGNVFKSIEVNNTMSIFTSLLLLSAFWLTMSKKLQEMFTYIFTMGYLNYGTIDTTSLMSLFKYCGSIFFSVTGPFMIILMVVGMTSNFLQVGVLFTPKTVMPKFERISPAGGLKKIFSMNTFNNFLKTLMKTGVVLLIAWKSIVNLAEEVSTSANTYLPMALEENASNMLSLALKLLIGMVTVSILDFAFQWFNHQKKIKMSKQEVKDEYKNTEGDPEVKAKIRGLQRQMAQARMMQDVPTADVVIANPTHYAVALKYDSKKNSAPVIVAKGADNIALKIKEIARKNKVEIVENREVARALFAAAEVGDEVPYELFNAVAEILAYILSKKRRRKR